MRHLVMLFGFYFAISLSLCGQGTVVDLMDLPADQRVHLKPDVMGKVVIRAESGGETTRINVLDTLTVFPGWPQTAAGYNERGGVYCNLDQDPEMEVIYPCGSMVHAYNLDGTNVPGWPVQLELIPDGAASFGDIDGDGYGEIVVTTHDLGSFSQGWVYAFEMNGADVLGFPVATEGGAVKTPVLADLDQDGADEIIIAVRNWPDGFVHAYHGDGSMVEGWPQRMNSVPATTVAVGDIDNDQVPDVIGQSYTGIHAWNIHGTIKPGFPFTPGSNRVFSHSSPVLADLDGDGHREILIGDHNSSVDDGRVHVLRSNGTYMDNWPRPTDHWIYSPPSVGDINGDGNPDVVIADYSHEISNPTNKIYAWDGVTGTLLPGFPIDSLFGIFNQLLIADIDGDNHVEIICDANIGPGGIYFGFNHDGSEMEGWPILTDGSTFGINPFIADLNGDGIVEMSGGGYNANTEQSAFYLWDTQNQVNEDLAYLTILQYNTRHTGVYGDVFMVSTPEQTQPVNSLRAIPNPASEHVQVHFDDTQPGHLVLVSASGTVVLNQKMGRNMGSPIQVPVGHLPDGLYLLVMQLNDGTTTSQRLIVR